MDWQQFLGLAAIGVGATWALRSKLGDIEVALGAHVARDDERHADLKAQVEKHDDRIVKLEDYRGRR